MPRPTLREEQLEHLWRCFDTELGVATNGCWVDRAEGTFKSPNSLFFAMLLRSFSLGYVEYVKYVEI